MQHRCGHQITDTVDVTDHGYLVEKFKCEACAAIAQVRDKYHEDHKDKDGRSDVDAWTFYIADDTVPPPSRP